MRTAVVFLAPVAILFAWLFPSHNTSIQTPASRPEASLEQLQLSEPSEQGKPASVRDAIVSTPIPVVHDLAGTSEASSSPSAATTSPGSLCPVFDVPRPADASCVAGQWTLVKDDEECAVEWDCAAPGS